MQLTFCRMALTLTGAVEVKRERQDAESGILSKNACVQADELYWKLLKKSDDAMMVVIKDKLVTSEGRWLAVKLSDILEVLEPFAQRLKFTVHHTDGVMLHDWASWFTVDELDADPPPILTWENIVALAREIRHLTDITLDGVEPGDDGDPVQRSSPTPDPALTICCFDASQWEVSFSNPEIASALLSRFRDVAVID